jgi:hypothetical protein
MSLPDLEPVTQAVVGRAQKQGYIVPHEVREELAHAGLPEERWKDVLEQARASLSYRHGRYYYVPAAVARLRERSRHDQDLQQELRKSVRQLIQQFRKEAVDNERREHDRIQVLQRVKVLTAEGRAFNLLACDVSLTGVRLLGTHDVLGHKIKVVFPRSEPETKPWCFLVHVLWTNLVADNLYECGGMFVEALADEGGLKIAGTENGD